MGLKTKSESVVFQPEVQILGFTKLNAKSLRKFLNKEGFSSWSSEAKADADLLAEVAGRVCYLSFDGGRPNPEYLANIKSQGHGSVLEHASLSFLLSGVSRSFTHELVRHRAGWAYSQLSQRYVDHDDCQFVCPSEIAACQGSDVWGHLYDSWLSHCKAQQALYKHIKETLAHKLASPAGSDLTEDELRASKRIHKKRINGCARSVLPECTETKLICTANARALRHFLEMRGGPEADAEIRAVAVKIWHEAVSYMPEILSDFECYSHEHHGFCLRNNHRKV